MIKFLAVAALALSLAACAPEPIVPWQPFGPSYYAAPVVGVYYPHPWTYSAGWGHGR